ncbi:MAG: hypothetical protein Q9201_005144 [Fulgogasparrea decipioides]
MLVKSNTTLLISAAALLVSLSPTTATKVDHALQYRQNVPIGTAASASAASSNPPAGASSAAPPATPPAASSPSSVNAPVPASTTVAVQTTSGGPNDSPPVSTTLDSQSTTPGDDQDSTSTAKVSIPTGTQSTITSPSEPRSTDASKASTQSPSVSASSQTQKYFVTTVFTISGSSTRTNVLTTSGLVLVSASTTSNSKPSLDASDSGSSKTGLDSSQKRIIIGVVVGIGGAILLGGIAVVAWRVWGRKARSTDDDNDLMDSHPGSSGREKRSSVSGHSPFRSTLDQYHHQPGPVNTASNF